MQEPGHLMTQISIKRILCARRPRDSQRGFTLMELLIVMSIMIILMLIAIPNFISMKAQADETSAIQSLRAIYQAQIQYQTDFPASGFSCSLAALGGNASAGPPTSQAAQVLQGDLAGGQKSGYTFNVVNCTKVTVNNQDMYTSYQATAVPQSIGKSGHRGFCIDEAGEIKADLSGGTNCSQAIQ
jgi:type IV pilus assembly protein PilA